MKQKVREHMRRKKGGKRKSVLVNSYDRRARAGAKKVKIRYPKRIVKKATEEDYAVVERFMNIIAPFAESEYNLEIRRARSAWSKIRDGKGRPQHFRSLDNFIDVVAPEYMAKDPGIKKGRRAWGRILLAGV